MRCSIVVWVLTACGAGAITIPPAPPALDGQLIFVDMHDTDYSSMNFRQAVVDEIRTHLVGELAAIGLTARDTSATRVPMLHVRVFDRNSISAVLSVDGVTVRDVTADASACTSGAWGVYRDENERCLARALIRDLIANGGIAQAYPQRSRPTRVVDNTPSPPPAAPTKIRVVEAPQQPPPPPPPPASDSVAAQTLFDQAKAHIQKGDYASACPLLEASYRADPQLGTLLNLADCHEHVGKTATAWTEFRAASDLGHLREDTRGRYADERIAKLEPRLDRLRIAAPSSPPPGLTVTRDGTDVTAILGVAAPVDPGDHVIVASAPGYSSWQTTVAVTGEGITSQAEIGRLAAAR